jgi:hypothetical protein
MIHSTSSWWLGGQCERKRKQESETMRERKQESETRKKKKARKRE